MLKKKEIFSHSKRGISHGCLSRLDPLPRIEYAEWVSTATWDLDLQFHKKRNRRTDRSRLTTIISFLTDRGMCSGLRRSRTKEEVDSIEIKEGQNSPLLSENRVQKRFHQPAGRILGVHIAFHEQSQSIDLNFLLPPIGSK